MAWTISSSKCVGCRALVKDYRSAHLLVSEPSEVSEPNFGLAADYHALSGVRLPAIHPVFTVLLPKRAAY
jgi:hypothetical protein